MTMGRTTFGVQTDNRLRPGCVERPLDFRSVGPFVWARKNEFADMNHLGARERL